MATTRLLGSTAYPLPKRQTAGELLLGTLALELAAQTTCTKKAASETGGLVAQRRIMLSNR